MSKIGKKPVEIPEGVEVKIEGLKEGGFEVAVKGAKGELKRKTHSLVRIKKEKNSIVFSPAYSAKKASALWGTERSLIANMIKGVKDGFSKQLEIQGIGYKAELKGEELVLSLGFSYPIVFKVPEGIEVKVEKNIITISGIDKQKVGQTAAKIRSFRKPEPYKGKGIRYVGEVIIRKAGKKAVSAK